MREILYLVGLLVVLNLLRGVIPFVIAHVFGRAVGKVAMAKQPDEIHLTRASAWAWKNADAANAATAPLRQLGFRDAGIYSVPEMPGLLLRLLENEQESAYAVFYEHPQAGTFGDVAIRYQDGGSLTVTSSAPTGLRDRPDHPSIHMTGASLPELFARLTEEKLPLPTRGASVEGAQKDFEAAYAESIAWRKKAGVSSREVAEVARKRAA
jgi:hypothetical protein